MLSGGKYSAGGRAKAVAEEAARLRGERWGFSPVQFPLFDTNVAPAAMDMSFSSDLTAIMEDGPVVGATPPGPSTTTPNALWASFERHTGFEPSKYSTDWSTILAKGTETVCGCGERHRPKR